MDLQAIEARLRANEAGRDGELYEHAPEDIQALLGAVERNARALNEWDKRVTAWRTVLGPMLIRRELDREKTND